MHNAQVQAQVHPHTEVGRKTQAAGEHAYLAIHVLNACNQSGQVLTLTARIANVPTSFKPSHLPPAFFIFKPSNLPPAFFPRPLICCILLPLLFASRALILPGLRRVHSSVLAYPCGLGRRAGGGPVETLEEDGIDVSEHSRQREAGREGPLKQITDTEAAI